MRKQPKKPSKDELWKSIIQDFFEEFMHYYFPQQSPNIDFSKGYEFLNQELDTIYPESQNQNRRADRLVKVWLKNGEPLWILVHIEVQGYVDDEFAFRVYSSHYRIRDRYGKPVAVFIIYTDNSPSFHPESFEEECLGTLSLLRFPTYKLLNHPPEIHEDRSNIFSIISQVAWYELKKDKFSDENYLDIGKKIVWKLARRGYDERTIVKVMQFIRYYFPFEKRNNLSKFEREAAIIFKKEKHMGIIELVRKYEIENIREESREEGMEKGIDLILKIMDMKKRGVSVESMSEQLKVSIEKVNKILSKLE